MRIAAALVIVSTLAACSGNGRDPAVEAAQEAEAGDATTGDESVGAGPPDGADPAANSADRFIFWLGCDRLANLSDDDLALWQERGVDGFACQTQALRALGGEHAFDPAPDAALDGFEYRLQRGLRESRIGERARSRGMKLYLSFYVVNRSGAPAPFADWFDDDAWSADVVPGIRALAGAARSLGFDGVGIDTELYPSAEGQRPPSWSWDYAGDERGEAAVRTEVQRRGAEVMDALVEGFPDVEVLIYGMQVPGSWEEEVQLRINNIESAYATNTTIDFLNGLSSADGFGAIRLLQAIFYKTTHLASTTWDEAMRHDAANLYALMSRQFPHWADVADRIHSSPFVWISAGPTEFERARSPEEVAEQLAAAARWGMGREFANFVFGDLEEFDYEPYVTAMQAASTPNRVTTDPPTIEVTEETVDADVGTVRVGGIADDAYAIRAIRWEDAEGRTGAATMTWEPIEPNFPARVRWQIDDVALDETPAQVRITVTNIKDLSTTVTVTLGEG